MAGAPCALAHKRPVGTLKRGTSQDVPRTSLDVIIHVARARPSRGRPDLAGSLSRCVRTDSRVELCAKPVSTLVEPRTFVKWVLKEQHSHQAFSQWRQHHTDGQSGLPSTALDQVSATERVPMSPPRPWVSVGTIHGQNTSGWHLSTGGVGRAIRQLNIGMYHRSGASRPSEPTREA